MNVLLAVGALCAALAAIGVALRFLYRSVRSAEDVIREANRVPDLAHAVAALGDRLDYLSNRPLMNGSGDLLIATVKAMRGTQETLAADVAEVKAQQTAHMKVDHRMIPGQWRPRHDDTTPSGE